MDSQISDKDKDKIKLTVINILKSSDFNSVTEQHVRNLTSQKLGIDLSSLPYKTFVRRIVESFLLFMDEDGDIKPVVHSPLVICKLSEKRDVAVTNCGGKKVVSIRELSGNDGKPFPTPKCTTSLLPDEWSVFRKSIPAIEEAIVKVELRLRLELDNEQVNSKRDLSAYISKQNSDGQRGVRPSKKHCALPRPTYVATREQAEDASAVASIPQKLVPMGIIRLDGKNYPQWADLMKSHLNKLKVFYVLSEPCPSAKGVEDSKLKQILCAAERWKNDDHVCRQSILNSLCDHLFGHYLEKSCTAKDLWEELELAYLHEENGANVSLVKKYIEFQIVEERSVFEQVHEFNLIADALQASGMPVNEQFHVNTIISKLPASWKPNSIELMKKDYLPIWTLMNHLKAEGESRQKGDRGAPFLSSVSAPSLQPSNKPRSLRFSPKKPGYPHAIGELDRDKKIKYCSFCNKKGHNREQCWHLNSREKDIKNDKNDTTEGAAGHDAN